MKIAICLYGAVSRIEGASTYAGDLYESRNYAYYNLSYDSIAQHIINVNQNHSIDFFIHSWSYDLSKELIDLYQPKLYNFEDNNLYHNLILNKCATKQHAFAGISSALSKKKVIELKEKYEIDNNQSYDIVLLYRPDLLLIKDINFDNYDLNAGIYTEGFQCECEGPVSGRNTSLCQNCRGDLFYLMQNQYSNVFKGLYDSNTEFACHIWTSKYLKQYNINLLHDTSIIHAHDIGVARPDFLRRMYKNNGVNCDRFRNFIFRIS